ncbi:thyroid adenoma-associated protein [Brachionichthys hirsutus]|uniref:thyroid adenoma-associated protein n=1 Tax=Brachionichthys hirsutus TaxID=412623 RepID=UPI003604AC4A
MVVKKKTVQVEALVLDEETLHELLASLTVNEEEDAANQLARTLRACFEQREPVQQIRLIKKAGSQLGTLDEERPDGRLLGACLHALSSAYTSLRARSPMRRAVASRTAPSARRKLMGKQEFIQSVQSTAGMAVVLLIRSVLGSGEAVASMMCGLLCSPVQGLDCAPRWLQQRCEGLCPGLCPEARRPGVALYLCHGALAMLDWKGAEGSPPWERLLLLLADTLLDLDVSITQSNTAMVVSRVLTLWSSAAMDFLQGEERRRPLRLSQAFRGGSALQRRLLERIDSHWEHPLDGVRHQTRFLFHNLLLVHQRAGSSSSSDPTEDSYVRELSRSLLALEWHVRGKYASLGCLVELCGSGYLLDMQPQLPSVLVGLMGDQTLAPYASDLLERLFVSHKAQLLGEVGASDQGWLERWHQTWIAPLLQVLCRARPDQTMYILDYFLPKLLHCSPSSLAYMVQALQEAAPRDTGPCGSRGALGALVTCLRAARAQGVIPSSASGLWGGLVPLSLLQQALVHKHDQVRMDALGLVCESHRSTEVLTSQEMDLVRHFLLPNLNSQTPCVRQQTASLLKKLLCRMKDSTLVMQKKMKQTRDREQRGRDQNALQLYKEFLRWLCEALLDVLLPGASFSTCLMSLQLLGLLGQLFTFSTGPAMFVLCEVVTPVHAQNVLYCVGSNFLEVKQLAVALLQQLPPCTVGLQVRERMSSVLRAALCLSTSTKPFDSVTAAYLLSLLLPQSGLIHLLQDCAQEEGLHFLPPSLPTSPSETVTLELNTLALVQFLLRALESEVLRAESSLLQAAASCPLYGRAHCITAVLQHLNAGSFSQTEQWRRVVAALIAVCYRMSDVVSPVVQSSSPEGLIPMDNNSDASASLQRILQEIQPRDTNDFFTRVRELDTHGDDRTHSQAACTGESPSGGQGYRVTAQMVLVCCWRTMKEVAMLFGQICQSLPLQYTNDGLHTHPGLVTEAQVEDVGLYFRRQLLQSRHRGAFELASVGFERLTDMLCRSESRALQQLPSCWLSEVLQEVQSSDQLSKLCATRRSAGIPFYVQALLSSEPKSSTCSLLKATMRQLITLATPSADRSTDSATIPQVHALNILRALYRDTRLGENVVPFVSDGMRAAVLGFTAPVWAVRNSSTLLFSTLITRIFGVKKGKDEHSKKNRMTGREFFTRFPALYPFLLRQLEEAATTVESDGGRVRLHHSLFLLLLVLSRLYPSPMDGSSSPLGLAAFMPFIIRCAHSAVYRTREMAARALVPFVLLTQIPSTVHTLLKELPTESGHKVQHNYIHGTLLQVLLLLRCFRTESHRPLPAGNGVCEALCRRMWLASRQNGCVVTRGAFVDVLVCLCGLKTSILDESEVAVLRQEASSVLMASELFTCDTSLTAAAPGSTQYLLSLARLALAASVEVPELWGGAEVTGQLLRRLLQSSDYEVRQLALQGVLRRLQDDEEGKKLQWLDESTLSTITSLSLHETHPQCLAKVFTVLSVTDSTRRFQWRDGVKVLAQEEILLHLLGVAKRSASSVELYCAALTLASQQVLQMVTGNPQGVGAVAGVAEWGALVGSFCSEQQPVELKLTVAEVLVSSTAAVLSSPRLPLGLPTTLSLWRSLFTLLQDEDQEVRDSASDFMSAPAPLLHAGVSVCPAVALDSGVELLCQLFEVWGRVPAGVLAVTEWLLGDEDGDDGGATDGPSRLDEEDMLFQKGDLNLWAEPVQWVKMLHRHLSALVMTFKQSAGIVELDQAHHIHVLLTQAQAKAFHSQQALDSIPALPQFSCPMKHARLVLQHQRATLALDVLDGLR